MFSGILFASPQAGSRAAQDLRRRNIGNIGLKPLEGELIYELPGGVSAQISDTG